MNGIFAADSGLMRFLSRVADLMILNVVFIVTSLPIVTLGASLTALSFVSLRIVDGTDRSVLGEYFTSFRSNFRQASVLWLILVLLGAVLAGWYVVVTELVDPSILQFVLLAVWFVLCFAFAMAALYVFPYLAKFEGSIAAILRNARLMAAKHPLAPMAVIVVTGLALTITIFIPQLAGYGLLWLLIGFSGIAFLGAVLYARVFDIYARAAPPQ